MINNNLDYLYEENILEHNRYPKNKIEKINNQDKNLLCCKGQSHNVDCGDMGQIYIYLEKDSQNIKDIFWSGTGCAISQAGMSLLTEKIKKEKLKLQDLKLWTPAVIYELLGVKISPSRANCALLSYKCLEDALKNLKIN